MHEHIEFTKNEKDGPMSATLSTTTIDNNGPLQMRQQYRQQEQLVFSHKQLQFQQHVH